MAFLLAARMKSMYNKYRAKTNRMGNRIIPNNPQDDYPGLEKGILKAPH